MAADDKPAIPDIAVAHTVLTLSLAQADARTLAATEDLATVAVRHGFRDVGTIIGIPATVLPALPATAGVPASYRRPPRPRPRFSRTRPAPGSSSRSAARDRPR